MRARTRLAGLIRKYQRRQGQGEVVADLQRLQRALYGKRLRAYALNRRLFDGEPRA